MPSSICAGAKLAARAGLEIGADGLGLDPAVALDNDGIDGSARPQRPKTPRRDNPGADKDTPEDDTAKRQPPHNPHTQVPCANAPFFILAAAPAPDSDRLSGKL